MPLNTFIDLLDRIASAWEGYKVMADHIRKVSAETHGNQYYSPEKGRKKIQSQEEIGVKTVKSRNFILRLSQKDS